MKSRQCVKCTAARMNNNKRSLARWDRAFGFGGKGNIEKRCGPAPQASTKPKDLMRQ